MSFHRRHGRCLALAMLTGLTFGPGTPTWAQQKDLSPPAASREGGQVADSHTNSVIRSFHVSPKLPRYRFVLRPDTWSDKAYPAPSEHIGRMDVFKGNSKVALQSIDVQGTHPSWLTNSFRSVDINMDGFQDIAVIYQVAGKWHSESYWVFDPGPGRYITNALTADLRKLEHNGLKLNPPKKEIRASHFIGPCLKSFEIYRIEKGRLVLMESEMHSPKEAGRCLVEKRKRVKGKMVLVEKKEQRHEIPPSL